MGGTMRRMMTRARARLAGALPVLRGARPPEAPPGGTPPEEWLRREVFLLAGLLVPKWLVEFDTVFSGGKGTGKTTVMLAMMRSLLVGEAQRSLAAWNAFAYTPKNDDFYWALKSWLEPYGVSVRSTNPFRRGSWAWSPFRGDLRGLAAVEQATRAFVKEDPKENNRYFRDAARLLVRGALVSLLATHPGRATFRRVVLVLKSRYLLHQVLARCPQTCDLLSLVDDSTQGTAAGNVYTTLLTTLKDLEILAAEVDATPEERRYSMAEVANRPGVCWVWEGDPRYEAVMELWNGLQDDFLTPHLLVRGDVGFTTYRFIDELPQMNGRSKSTNSQKLSEWGRSSRVRNVYAFQTKAQLDETWGEPAADGFLGQCHNYVVFKHSDLAGRRYWSRRMGNARGFELTRNVSTQSGWSNSYGPQGGYQESGSRTEGVSEQRYDRARVAEGVLGDLPVGSLQYGLFGFAGLPISPRVNPETRAPDSLLWRFHITPDQMRASRPPRHPDFEPYARSMKPLKDSLEPLEDDEHLLLGLDPDPNRPKP